MTLRFSVTKFQFILASNQTKYNLLTRLMMKEPTQTLRQTGRPKTRIHKNFQGYYCACQALFKTPQEYKHHVLSTHNGIFIQGSSHFIAKFSQTVLPCKCWDPQSVQNHQALLPPLKNNQTILPEYASTKQGYTSVLSLTSRNKPKPKKKEKNNQIEEDVPSTQIQRKNVEQSVEASSTEEPIVWNGFQLIPHKRHAQWPFFCGFCRMGLQSTEEFITHCFDKCQQLDHPDSSHFISQAETQVVNPPIKRKQPEISACMGASRSLQDYIQKIRAQEVPMHLKKIYQNLYLNKQSEDNLSKEHLRCGCGQLLQKNKYLRHIVLKHQEVIPRGSTHIILRRQQQPVRANIVSISSFDESTGWSCPCRPQINMTGFEFVKHIIYIHRGISLVYSPSKFRAQQPLQ